MRKILSLFLCFLVLFSINTSFVSARAGGGSSSSGGGSSGVGGGGSHGTSHVRGNTPSNGDILSEIVGVIVVFTFAFSSSIAVKIKIVRSKYKSRVVIKRLSLTDDSWNYKDLQKRVIDTYFVVQDAWGNNDLSKASSFMMPSLLERFQMKLNFMELQNRKNIMECIELRSAFLVSLYNDSDAKKDYVWYYIKGRMVDYIVNTDANEVLEGSKFKKTFVEYWQFKRDKNNGWVLNKILQEDEHDKVLQ